MARTYETIATGTARHPLGTYTVTLAIDETAAPEWTRPDPVLTLDVSDVGDLTYAGPDTPLGTGLFGASLSLTFNDPAGDLSTPLDAGRADPGALRLTVSGPDGWGGTLTWAGRYVPAEDDETLSPLVYRPGEVQTEWACGIGPAEDTAPAVMPTGAGYPLYAAAALGTLAEHPVLIRLSPVPMDGASPDPDVSSANYGWTSVPEWSPETVAPLPPGPRYRYGTEPTLAGDSLADQLSAVCKTYGAVCYLSLRQATPEWHIVPRWLLGLDVDDGTSLAAGTVSSINASRTYPATERTGRTVTIPGTWSREGRIRRRVPPREVAIRYPEGSVLNADPGLEDSGAWTAIGTPTFADDRGGVAFVGNYVTLDSGDGIGQTLGSIAAGDRVLVRVSALYDTLADPLPRVRVSVDDGVDTHYWDGAAWQTTTDEADAALETGDDGTDPSPSAPNASPSGHWCRVLTGAAPATGVLSVSILAPAGAGTTIYRVEITAADADGAVFYRFAVATGGAYAIGPPDEIPVPASVGPAEWLAEPTTNVYPDHGTAVAASRVAITAGEGGAPLRVIEAEVPGLLGPDTRVVFSGGGIGPIVCGFSGGSLSLERGVTTGTWTEIAPDPADALSARTLAGYPALPE